MVKKTQKNIHGVVLLDKPAGISSNQALQRVKHMLGAKKAGHTGSLDPLATGLLPICFGQATKISQYMLGSDKKYTTLIKLGEVTDTLDSDGNIIESRPVNISDAQIQKALEKFKGRIKQVPPMYSALKKDGQPLYKMARRGEVIDRPARDMMVHSLSASRVDKEHVTLKVHCSSGFYIRSLAHDLGEELGCGAHVKALRRTHIKSISVDQAVSLEVLKPAEFDLILRPIDSLLADMPAIHISEDQALSLSQGKWTDAEGLHTSELSRLYAPSNKLFGIGEVTSQNNLKTHKIFVGTD